MFRNVLVWIDDSASAAEALTAAVEMARASGGRVGLLSVAPRPRRAISLALPPFAPPVSQQRLAGQLDADAEHHVDAGARTVPADVPVTKLLSHGSVADALLEHTRDGRWDLVVVGLRSADHRPLRRRVATRLLRAGSIPVLVVPGPSEAGSPPARSAMTARRRRAARRRIALVARS